MPLVLVSRKGAKTQRKVEEVVSIFFAAFLCVFAPLREKSLK